MIILRTLAGLWERREAGGQRAGLLLLAWLMLLSFTVWKYGCVRSGREVFFLGFIAVLALVLEALPCERRVAQRWARGLALGTCGLSLITMQVFCFSVLAQIAQGTLSRVRPQSGLAADTRPNTSARMWQRSRRNGARRSCLAAAN